MYLIQQKSCNLLPQIRKKNKYIKIYGRFSSFKYLKPINQYLNDEL